MHYSLRALTTAAAVVIMVGPVFGQGGSGYGSSGTTRKPDTSQQQPSTGSDTRSQQQPGTGSDMKSQQPGTGSDTRSQQPGTGSDVRSQQPKSGSDSRMGQQPGVGSDTRMGQEPGTGSDMKTGQPGASPRASQTMVRKAQEQLKSEGHDPGPIDGLMGPKTQEAIKSFQRDENLPETGQLDQATLAKLGVEEGSGRQSLRR